MKNRLNLYLVLFICFFSKIAVGQCLINSDINSPKGVDLYKSATIVPKGSLNDVRKGDTKCLLRIPILKFFQGKNFTFEKEISQFIDFESVQEDSLYFLFDSKRPIKSIYIYSNGEVYTYPSSYDNLKKRLKKICKNFYMEEILLFKIDVIEHDWWILDSEGTIYVVTNDNKLFPANEYLQKFFSEEEINMILNQ